MTTSYDNKVAIPALGCTISNCAILTSAIVNNLHLSDNRKGSSELLMYHESKDS